MKVLPALVAGAAFALQAATAHGASLTLSTDPDPARLLPGDTFEIAVRTSADFPTFIGVNVDVTYDADVLSYITTTFSPIFDDDFLAPQSEPADASGPTTIQNITGATLFGSGSGAETLATLSFAAKAPGVTEVAITGTGGQLVVGPDGSFDAGLTTDATVVPLPASAALLATGLIGLLAARRRRSTA